MPSNIDPSEYRTVSWYWIYVPQLYPPPKRPGFIKRLWMRLTRKSCA